MRTIINEKSAPRILDAIKDVTTEESIMTFLINTASSAEKISA